MYNPIVASGAETGDLLDARLRAGNAHTAQSALDYILDPVDSAETALSRSQWTPRRQVFRGHPPFRLGRARYPACGPAAQQQSTEPGTGPAPETSA